MTGSILNPQVFISYSWSTIQHEQWVIEFAERLMSDGILVVFDKWDLKEGHDKHAFMEQMVSKNEISKVLVICDKSYQDKANTRIGGVGTESQLISKEVYDNIKQEKFIPIVREFDTNGSPCIPHFMSSRLYINLSDDNTFESEYQKLMRNLYDKPLHKKPAIGITPAYITSEDPVLLKTSRKVVEIKNSLLNNNIIVYGLITDYYQAFISNLEDFRLQYTNEQFDEVVYESIEKMAVLSNDFIDFIQVIVKYQNKIDIDGIHSFLESICIYFEPTEDVTQWHPIEFDNYRFIFYELTLYLIAILNKNKRYEEISFLINHRYFYQTRYNDKMQHSSIEIFNKNVASLDINRNNRLRLNRASITADLIKTRAIRKDISFTEIINSDLLLYYIGIIREQNFDWFPHTAIYNKSFPKIDLLSRLISYSHFEKVKSILGHGNMESLKAKLESLKNDSRYYNHDHWRRNIPRVENIINKTEIGTLL